MHSKSALFIFLLNEKEYAERNSLYAKLFRNAKTIIKKEFKNNKNLIMKELLYFFI